MSPFTYTKVSNESSQLDSLEPLPPPPSRLVSGWRRLADSVQFLRWPVTYFLLVVILICELSIFNSQSAPKSPGGELNGLVPEFATERKMFHADKRYASDHKTMASINATKQEWTDLMPRGGGFFEVKNHNSYLLPPPMNFFNKDVYAIAVFHQLHCLMHMALYTDKLVLQIRNKDFVLDEGKLWHNDHCFNYIRNALLCCGDTTLEGQSQTPEVKNIPGTDGTGAVHVCRNYEDVKRFAEKTRLSDAKEHL
ncbi:Thioesterase domain-containing [Pyrenophora seminiperda CCB06]|uniref:Thioesterase domain-containing n=1 Tax=Pyrenophora seminiperda CCB06 TaxID=1302712 RepID=A0A3M7M7G7_9PLEO|nr:Thioesterase domain-containing [Pyrenophora seminiperda CCB06]